LIYYYKVLIKQLMHVQQHLVQLGDPLLRSTTSPLQGKEFSTSNVPVVLHNPTELGGWPVGARSVSTTVVATSKVIWHIHCQCPFSN
jgi:hypothetical protein